PRGSGSRAACSRWRRGLRRPPRPGASSCAWCLLPAPTMGAAPSVPGPPSDARNRDLFTEGGSVRERTLDDLCTPRYVLDLVERVGEIGLDPCSNRWSIVPARVKLDIDEGRDGLSTAWKEILADGELVF